MKALADGRAHRDHRHSQRIESRRGSAAPAAHPDRLDAPAAIRRVQGGNRPRVARKGVAARRGREDEAAYLRDVSVAARAESHALMESGEHIGKIVLTVQ